MERENKARRVCAGLFLAYAMVMVYLLFLQRTPSGDRAYNDVPFDTTRHQLRLLKEEGLVNARRDGKNIFYSLDDQHVVDILDIAFIHIAHKTDERGDCCKCL